MSYAWSSFNQFYRKNTHVPVAEKSFTDAVQLIACIACICQRSANQLDKDSIHKITPSESNIESYIDSDVNIDHTNGTQDEIFDFRFVDEDALFDEISVENFLSSNDSDNNQICIEDMNEFMTSSRDPYIDVNLFDEPENYKENDEGII